MPPDSTTTLSRESSSPMTPVSPWTRPSSLESISTNSHQPRPAKRPATAHQKFDHESDNPERHIDTMHRRHDLFENIVDDIRGPNSQIWQRSTAAVDDSSVSTESNPLSDSEEYNRSEEDGYFEDGSRSGDGDHFDLSDLSNDNEEDSGDNDGHSDDDDIHSDDEGENSNYQGFWGGLLSDSNKQQLADDGYMGIHPHDNALDVGSLKSTSAALFLDRSFEDDLPKPVIGMIFAELPANLMSHTMAQNRDIEILDNEEEGPSTIKLSAGEWRPIIGRTGSVQVYTYGRGIWKPLNLHFFVFEQYTPSIMLGLPYIERKDHYWCR